MFSDRAEHNLLLEFYKYLTYDYNMISKLLMLIIIFLGILSITVSIVKNEQKCPKEKIIYKYLPRTFEEEQSEPVYVSDIFRTMFSQESPWIRNLNGIETRKNEAINKYFISQY